MSFPCLVLFIFLVDSSLSSMQIYTSMYVRYDIKARSGLSCRTEPNKLYRTGLAPEIHDYIPKSELHTHATLFRHDNVPISIKGICPCHAITNFQLISRLDAIHQHRFLLHCLLKENFGGLLSFKPFMKSDILLPRIDPTTLKDRSKQKQGILIES